MTDQPVRDRPEPQPARSDHQPRSAPTGSAEQVGSGAADIRPDLAATPQDEAERVSDAGSRRRDSTGVTVADNAGKTPGADQGDPDTGQEAGAVS